jgi:hypothetical protein
VIINPFVQAPAQSAAPPAASEAVTPETSDQVTVRPQLIVNPFYKPEAKVARHAP